MLNTKNVDLYYFAIRVHVYNGMHIAQFNTLTFYYNPYLIKINLVYTKSNC